MDQITDTQKVGHSRAKAAGETVLDFDRKDFRALDRIPDQIADLPDLAWLDLDNTKVAELTPLASLTALLAIRLDNTQVADLTPLAHLTALQELGFDYTQVADLTPLANLSALRKLWLDYTRVADLRPIRDLTKLGTEDDTGLDFKGTPFAEATEDTRRLAAIKDRQERTRETLAFLKTLPPWPEPLPWEIEKLEKQVATDTPAPPPEQDPSLPLIWGPQGFGFMAAHLDLDPLTAEALAELRDLLDALIRQSGNSHEDLHRLATEMRERCELQDGKLNALRLHMSFQKLERLHAGREGRERRLDDEIVTTLEGILLTAPGATLGDPQVATLIARQDANRATPAAPIDTARAEAVLDAVTEPEAPFDDEVKETAETANAHGPDDRITATRGILARNVVVAVGRRLALILTSPSEIAASGIIIGWVYTHRAALQAHAMTLGTDAGVWFTRVLQELGRIAPPL